MNYCQEVQPSTGPGGSNYKHDSVIFSKIEGEKDAEDYWLFEPTSPKPEQANVVVFNHGYGVYNPGPYGAWIEHIVKKGNIVIFPRYQHTELTTLPSSFTAYAVTSILNGIQLLLEDSARVKPNLTNFAVVGHSYGGVVSANLALKWRELGVPKPKALFSCTPGTGGFRGGRYKSYQEMDTSIHMLAVIGTQDFTVGGFFGKELYHKNNIPFKHKNLIKQKADRKHGIHSTHNECIAANKKYDGGINGGIIFGAYKVSEIDEVDYYCYWKLFDALLDCSFYNKNCEFAFGNTTEQTFMGIGKDGKEIKRLEVINK